MVIICASLCENWTKSYIKVKLYPLIIYTNSYDNMHDSGDAANKHSIIQGQMLFKVKDHEVNWKTYMWLNIMYV